MASGLIPRGNGSSGQTLAGDITCNSLTASTFVSATNIIAANISTGTFNVDDLNIRELTFKPTSSGTITNNTGGAGAVLTMPLVSTTLIGNNTTNTLTNKSLVDASTAIVDSVDSSKQILFNAGGTTATSTTLVCAQTANRIITFPDANTTVVGTTNSQVLSSKTLVTPVIAQINNGLNINVPAGISSIFALQSAAPQVANNICTYFNSAPTPAVIKDSGVSLSNLVTLNGTETLTNKSIGFAQDGSILDYYTIGNVDVKFVGPINSVTVNVKYTRIGKLVTLEVQPILENGTATPGFITATGYLPANILPSVGGIASSSTQVLVQDNGVLNGVGSFTVDSGNVMTLTQSLLSNFSGVGVCGSPQTFSISYFTD